MTERRKEQLIFSQRSTPASRIDNDWNTQENNISRAMEAPGHYKHKFREMIQINLLAKDLLCRNLCTIVIGYQSGHKAEKNKSFINSSACAFDTVRLCNYSNADTPYNRSVDVTLKVETFF